MAGDRRTLLAMAVLLAPALSGCLTPYRAHVDEDVLARAALEWSRVDKPVTDGGLFGVATAQTDYTHRGSGPPFSAILVVFSLRVVGRPATEELLRLTHAAVDNETAAKGIRVDQKQSSSGSRTLANGLQTRYFVEEGTSTSGGLFALNTKVRIIGEVGFDGASSTSMVAVGIAQVESSRSCPLNINCAITADQTSWIEMVGDPAGTVTGATTKTGLIQHLVTHG